MRIKLLDKGTKHTFYFDEDDNIDVLCGGKVCSTCLIAELAGDDTCSCWVRDNPYAAAEILGFEVVEVVPDETKPSEVSDKPKICELLGVDIGEPFLYELLEFELREDGDMTRRVNGVTGSASAKTLISIINDPSRIIRKPRFSSQDVYDALDVKRVFGRDGTVRRSAKKEDGPYSTLSFEHICIDQDLLPGLKEGQSCTLSEIIEGGYDG